MRTAIVMCCLILRATSLNGTERLTMKVWPAMSVAPAVIRVEALVEPDASNRLLRIVAESGDFYRASEVPFDGINAPRLSVVDYSQLPSGTYQVSAILVGTSGQRAAASRVIRVQPSGGR